MIVKRSGKAIIGAYLTSAERKAMHIEINKQILEADATYQKDIDAMVLYALNQHCGFGIKRLREFYTAFIKIHNELVAHYQMPNDGAWLAQRKLQDLGVDLDKWAEEEGIKYGAN